MVRVRWTATTSSVLAIVVAATFVGLIPANAADPDHGGVQSLYSDCKTEPSTSAQAVFCLGFVSGVGETMNFTGYFKQEHPDVGKFAICASPSHGAMVQAFINWAEKHPEEWAKSRIYGVMLALRETWPCKSD